MRADRLVSLVLLLRQRGRLSATALARDLDRAWQDRATRFRAGGDQVVVRLRVTAAGRKTLVDTAVAVLTEHGGEMEVAFQDRRHAEWALWQLGTNAEALEPPWLRAALRNRAARIVGLYGHRPMVNRRRSMPRAELDSMTTALHQDRR